MSEALEAVVHGQHVVALDDAHPGGGADGGVHTGAGGPHVKDGHVDVALVEIRWGSRENTTHGGSLIGVRFSFLE